MLTIQKSVGKTTWYRFCSQSINGRRASAALLTRSGLKSYTQKALNIMATKSNGGNPAWSKLKSTSKYNWTFTYNLQKGVTAVLNEGTGSKCLPENFHQDPYGLQHVSPSLLYQHFFPNGGKKQELSKLSDTYQQLRYPNDKLKAYRSQVRIWWPIFLYILI